MPDSGATLTIDSAGISPFFNPFTQAGMAAGAIGNGAWGPRVGGGPAGGAASRRRAGGVVSGVVALVIEIVVGPDRLVLDLLGIR